MTAFQSVQAQAKETHDSPYACVQHDASLWAGDALLFAGDAAALAQPILVNSRQFTVNALFTFDSLYTTVSALHWPATHEHLPPQSKLPGLHSCEHMMPEQSGCWETGAHEAA
ncbi:hypothetical protein HY642_05680 [Candidatus Woesearchaeota archaeon]|nr:hypothetical protein [Candidatus Woesearchaeota archaeon]